MTEGNSTAVHVYVVSVELESLLNGEILSCKCLVNLDEIDIRQLQSCLLQCNLRGRHGTDTHDLRRYTGDSPTHNASNWLGLRSISRGHHHGGASVDDATGIAGSNESVFRESRFKFGQNI